jgi:hypothetical protein
MLQTLFCSLWEGKGLKMRQLKASRRGGYKGAINTFNDDKLRIRLFSCLSKLPDIKSYAPQKPHLSWRHIIDSERGRMVVFISGTAALLGSASPINFDQQDIAAF